MMTPPVTHEVGARRNAAPLTETQLRAAVEDARIPPLLMVVYQFTGDETWLGERYRPGRAVGIEPRTDGGLSPEAQAEVRAAAVSAILAMRAGQAPALTDFDDEKMAELASFFVAHAVDARYGPLLRSEFSRRTPFVPEDLEPAPVTVPPGTSVIVIGLGLSGIAAINMLQSMGVEDYTVFERSGKPGGVWVDSKYPGAGVDVPSHLYTFSFAYRDWSKQFELRDELQSYFSDVLAHLQVTDRVHYDTTVERMSYDKKSASWTVQTRTGGELREHTASIVISAVGTLNQPRVPELPGMEKFAGAQFHSATWPEDLDLTGKRVAVIGVGASSQQICPQIAPRVEHLAVFQRSPQWVAPFGLLGQTIPEGHRSLLSHVPLYHAWDWLELFWTYGDTIIEQLRVDPTWPHQDRSVNAKNDGHRRFFTKYLTQQLEGRPDLIEKALPDYPPYGKRILLDNQWFQTIRRENVSLITEGVVEVDETGVIDSSGIHTAVDVIVWATGFRATQFLDSVEVRGDEGQTLSEAWGGDDPRAYLGVSVPHFPNLFLIGGPATFPGSGSVVYFTEVQTRYIRELLRQMFDKGIAAVAADAQVTEDYNDLIDEAHGKAVWSHPGFTTYYRNSAGRVVYIMPFTNLEYFEFVRASDLSDFTVYDGVEGAPATTSA